MAPWARWYFSRFVKMQFFTTFITWNKRLGISGDYLNLFVPICGSMIIVNSFNS
jgi:hypothetical protein